MSGTGNSPIEAKSSPAGPDDAVEALALALLRAVFMRPDLTPASRERFINDMVSGAEEVTMGFGDFREMARVAIASRVLDVGAERAAWHAWYYDPEGVGGKTFAYQDTREGHHAAFAAKSEDSWLESATRRSAPIPSATCATPGEQPATTEQPKPKKFPPEAYANIDPAYELLDDGSVRHGVTGTIRPKFYSDLPIPFKVGDNAKVVDANWQFPLGKIGKITHIEQGVVYFDGVACCWERLDPHSAGGA